MLARRSFLALGLGMLAPLLRAAPRYPDVLADMPLVFPRDDGAHPAFRNEWWYVTGWLRDDAGKQLGFQLTFFRNRPGVAEESRSRFAPRQLLFAHAALADPGQQRLRVDQRAAREGFGLAGASAGATDVHIGDWSLAQQAGHYRMRVPAREFAIDATLVTDLPVLLQGDAGMSRKGPDPRDASFYYSVPQLAVAGTLDSGGRRRSVGGVAWLDHEWSSRYLPQDASGWDWTGINFDDGAALMAFRIRDRSGATIWSGGAYRDRHGGRRVFGPSDIAFVPLRRWRSPRSGIEYPVSFQVRAGDLVVTLDPLFPDQELDARASVGIVYWEGAVRADLGNQGTGAGRGYLELTGYGEPLRL